MIGDTANFVGDNMAVKLRVSLPIEVFIKQVMRQNEAEKIVSDWYLDRDQVIQIVVKKFQEMGIFVVEPFGYADFVEKQTIHFLKSDPTLLQAVEKERQKWLTAQHSRRR